MNTTITTAARRIARDVNATHETVTSYYDADGHSTTRTADAAARIAGRKGSRFGRITEAEVQARLDVAAKVGQIAGPDFDVELALRLA